jgi:PhnB protein
MTEFGLTPYLQLPGTARAALTFYRELFGGALQLHTFEDFGRSDGSAQAIAHGVLTGRVSVSAADAGDGEETFSSTGLFFSLLGTGTPEESHSWFAALAEGGEVLDALQQRPWGGWDGQVRDRFGLTWLIGYELDG